jgi:succinate dehydrogenase/fumarate reductase flavoprotein subunit
VKLLKLHALPSRSNLIGYDSIEDLTSFCFGELNTAQVRAEMQDTMQNYAAVFLFGRELGVGWVEIDKVVEKFNVV